MLSYSEAFSSSIKRALLLSLVTLFASCGGGEGASQGSVARLEVSPSAVLLNGAGQTQALKVLAFDTNGVEIANAPIAFISSQPEQVTVSRDGTVTAVNPVGSAIISVSSGSVSAPPLLVAAVEAYSNSVFVSDMQVLAGPQSVPSALNGIEGQYTVVVKGIAAPAPGTVMLASGSFPIAGKVVSSSVGSGGALTVTLALAPLNQLFRNLSVFGTLSPEQLAQFVKPGTSTGNGLTTRSRPRAVTARSKKFGLFECTTSFDASLLNVNLTPTIEQSLAFAYDLSVLDGTSKAFLLQYSGSIGASLSGTVTVGAAAGSVDCTAPLLTIPIPITGPLSAIIVPEAPLGLAFRADLDASTNVVFGVSGSVKADLTFGVKYDAMGQQVKINDGTVFGQIDILPTFANTAARVKLTEFGGLVAGLTVGNVLGKLPNAIEVSAGSELLSSWGMPYDAAQDPLFATEYQLKTKLAIGPGPGLQMLLDLAEQVISIDITAAFENHIGRSPMSSSVRLTQNSFKAGDSLTFKVALDPTTVRFPLGLGAYNIQEIRLYRLDSATQSATQIVSAIASDGQMEFTIPWVANGDGNVDVNGKPAFFAFVVPRLLNMLRSEFPIELGRVAGPSIELRPAQAILMVGDKSKIDAYLDGNKTASSVSWSASGGTITALGEYTAGNVPGTYEIRATRDSTGEVAIASVQVQAVASPQSVTSVAMNPPSPIIGNQVTFSINGANLQSGYTFSLPGCAATEVPSESTILRQFVCTVTIAGSNLAGTVTTPSGAVLYSFDMLVTAIVGPDHWKGAGLLGESVLSLAIDRGNLTGRVAIYAGTKHGIFRSEDSGASWAAVNTGISSIKPVIRAIAIDPQNSSAMYAISASSICPCALGRNLNKSQDGGASWNSIASYINSPPASIVIDPSQPSILYAGSEGQPFGGVLKSIDGGVTWKNVTGRSDMSDFSGQPNVTSVVLGSPNTSIIYAATQDKAYNTLGKGIFKSSDAGQTWLAINDGLPSATGYGHHPIAIVSLAIDPNQPSTLYAGSAQNGVFKSVDGGLHWDATGAGLPDVPIRTLVIDHLFPATLYAGTNGAGFNKPGAGVFRTTDGGISWIPMNDGLTDLDILSFSIDPSDSTHLFIGTANSGVFERGPEL